MKMRLLNLISLASLVSSLIGQNTVGLVSYDRSQSYEGVNLIYPHNQSDVFLINGCGEVVHRWSDSTDFRPGNTAYLLPDGRLVKTKRPSSVSNDVIWAGGGGATIEIRDWDNNLEWSFTLNDSTARLHHDIEVMPNGHILTIVWERKSRNEAIAAGRDSSNLTEDELWPDAVYEIDPENDSIVWRWHVWDHLVQDFDSTKNNFGVVSDHPELIDINFDDDGDPDWLHTNAIDYHPERDQILLCIPFLHEIWIIDHSTSTQEAASHTGGLAGRGGDLLYRWGNPQAYRVGVPEDQLLFNPHDAHWVRDFLTPSHADFDDVMIFNNQAGIDFSQVNTIETPWDMYLWSYNQDNGFWGPSNYHKTLFHPTPSAFFSTGLSSAQALPNGNYLFCSGRQGYSIELTPENEIVWEYITPLRRGTAVEQGDSLQLSDNLTFRMDRYPIDYPAFTGRDLTGNNWIEINPDSSFCTLTSIIRENAPFDFIMYPNPASNTVYFDWPNSQRVSLEIYSVTGKKLMHIHTHYKYESVDISELPEGIYFVRIEKGKVKKLWVNHP